MNSLVDSIPSHSVTWVEAARRTGKISFTFEMVKTALKKGQSVVYISQTAPPASLSDSPQFIAVQPSNLEEAIRAAYRAISPDTLVVLEGIDIPSQARGPAGKAKVWSMALPKIQERLHASGGRFVGVSGPESRAGRVWAFGSTLRLKVESADDDSTLQVKVLKSRRDNTSGTAYTIRIPGTEAAIAEQASVAAPLQKPEDSPPSIARTVLGGVVGALAEAAGLDTAGQLGVGALLGLGSEALDQKVARTVSDRVKGPRSKTACTGTVKGVKESSNG